MGGEEMREEGERAGEGKGGRVCLNAFGPWHGFQGMLCLLGFERTWPLIHRFLSCSAWNETGGFMTGFVRLSWCGCCLWWS